MSNALEVSGDIAIRNITPVRRNNRVAVVDLVGPVTPALVQLLQMVEEVQFSLRSRIARLGFDIDFKLKDYELNWKNGIPQLALQARLRNVINVSQTIFADPPSNFFSEGTALGRFFVVDHSQRLDRAHVRGYRQRGDITLPNNIRFHPDEDCVVIIPLLPERHVLTPEGQRNVADILYGGATRGRIMRDFQTSMPVNKSQFGVSPGEGMIGAIQLGFRGEVFAVIQRKYGDLVHSHSRLLDQYTGYTQREETVVVEVRNGGKGQLQGRALSVAVEFYPTNGRRTRS